VGCPRSSGCAPPLWLPFPAHPPRLSRPRVSPPCGRRAASLTLGALARAGLALPPSGRGGPPLKGGGHPPRTPGLWLAPLRPDGASRNVLVAGWPRTANLVGALAAPLCATDLPLRWAGPPCCARCARSARCAGLDPRPPSGGLGACAPIGRAALRARAPPPGLESRRPPRLGGSVSPYNL